MKTDSNGDKSASNGKSYFLGKILANFLSSAELAHRLEKD